jgi:hypothetical protein
VLLTPSEGRSDFGRIEFVFDPLVLALQHRDRIEAALERVHHMRR